MFDETTVSRRRLLALLATEVAAHRIFNGIGHNVPQEAPQPFTAAVIDASKL